METSRSFKRCVNCAHFSDPMWCNAGAEISLVDGRPLAKFAILQRKDVRACGPEAALYRAATPKPGFLVRLRTFLFNGLSL